MISRYLKLCSFIYCFHAVNFSGADAAAGDVAAVVIPSHFRFVNSRKDIENHIQN